MEGTGSFVEDMKYLLRYVTRGLLHFAKGYSIRSSKGIFPNRNSLAAFNGIECIDYLDVGEDGTPVDHGVADTTGRFKLYRLRKYWYGPIDVFHFT
jgi:hypothetical protein